MNELLKIGQTLRAASGCDWQVDGFLGAGGQGEVYRVRMAERDAAVKWYFPEQASADQRASLEKLVARGSPDARFLWPIELLSSPEVSGFGYLMRLRDPRFKSLLGFVAGRVDASFRTLAWVGFNLADGFFQLHHQGLCYRDISFGNAFFDPATGDVAICDNDNVTIDDGSVSSGVLGTPDFMAPEIVRGEAAPSMATDLHSLAVLLFYLFHINHPLYGRRVLDIHCLDLMARRHLCGSNPLFIFDPVDPANEAVSNEEDPDCEAGGNALRYWSIYPAFLRKAFTRSFTQGLWDAANGRVRETEWRKVMTRLRDRIVYCVSCEAENFYDQEDLASRGGPGECWQCHDTLRLPFRLRLGSEIVVLRHDSRLFPHHVEPDRNCDFSHPIAEVTIRPGQVSVWGLKNLSGSRWTASLPGGSVAEVAPGQTVALSSGLRISFGAADGEVRL
jgi:serine/threonine protein kinase